MTSSWKICIFSKNRIYFTGFDYIYPK